jgi:hypothetical protein
MRAALKKLQLPGAGMYRQYPQLNMALEMTNNFSERYRLLPGRGI